LAISIMTITEIAMFTKGIKKRINHQPGLPDAFTKRKMFKIGTQAIQPSGASIFLAITIRL